MTARIVVLDFPVEVEAVPASAQGSILAKSRVVDDRADGELRPPVVRERGLTGVVEVEFQIRGRIPRTGIVPVVVVPPR